MSKNIYDQITIDFFKEISMPKAIGVIVLISLIAFLFLIWLIYFRETAEETAGWVGHLPALNALLNSTSTVMIIACMLSLTLLASANSYLKSTEYDIWLETTVKNECCDAFQAVPIDDSPKNKKLLTYNYSYVDSLPDPEVWAVLPDTIPFDIDIPPFHFPFLDSMPVLADFPAPPVVDFVMPTPPVPDIHARDEMLARRRGTSVRAVGLRPQMMREGT
jgi:hypothetical protein